MHFNRLSVFRTLQALLAVGAVVVLTGAKGAGCGGNLAEQVGDQTGAMSSGADATTGEDCDPTRLCPAGFHSDVVCDSTKSEDPKTQSSGQNGSAEGNTASGASGNSTTDDNSAAKPSESGEVVECKYVCVPDQLCPKGFSPELVCAEPDESKEQKENEAGKAEDNTATSSGETEKEGETSTEKPENENESVGCKLVCFPEKPCPKPVDPTADPNKPDQTSSTDPDSTVKPDQTGSTNG